MTTIEGSKKIPVGVYWTLEMIVQDGDKLHSQDTVKRASQALADLTAAGFSRDDADHTVYPVINKDS